MERLFESFDEYIEGRLNGARLREEQKLVLSYLIKSERANEQLGYTILLTPDNNHFAALQDLEKAGLIFKHPLSLAAYPIFVADRVLLERGYATELRELFGPGYDSLEETAKDALGLLYRHGQFSKSKSLSAKQTAFSLWQERGEAADDIRKFDAFYRKIRYVFNTLEKAGFVEKVKGTRGYMLRRDYKESHLV
jgi:hypothetical protein